MKTRSLKIYRGNKYVSTVKVETARIIVEREIGRNKKFVIEKYANLNTCSLNCAEIFACESCEDEDTVGFDEAWGELVALLNSKADIFKDFRIKLFERSVTLWME